MNITLEFQQLDDLIVKHTVPPVTAILRNKLHPLREQMESYVTDKENVTALLQKAQAENTALKLTLPNDESKDTIEFQGVRFKGVSKGPDQVQVFCSACNVALSRSPGNIGHGIPMMCPRCHFRAPFTSWNIAEFISKLSK